MFGRSRRKPKPKGSKRVQLGLEALESRTLPSVASGTAVPTDPYASDRIVVQWSGAAPTSTPDSTSIRAIGNDTYDVYLANGVSVTQAVSDYSSLAGVVYAQPDYTLALAGTAVTPNDPNYNSQWNLAAINAPSAWNVTAGSNNVIVAVIDTGIDYNQQDLQNNLWHNTDGSVGWNFIANDNNPYDDNGHGTAVAGVIGAQGNNGLGIAGVDWNVQLMALKFMDGNGNGSTSDAASAIYYAVEHGAKIINASWGGSAYDPALASAISYAQQQGVIFVVAAGNDGTNNDTTAAYPANYSYSNVVAVAATDENNNLASYSNYGPNSVALAAPGSDILTTTPNNTYTNYTGTSLAAPEVTGALALVWSEHPTWTDTQVIAAVLNSVDPLSSLTGKVSTGGILDLYKAVTYAAPATTATTAAPAATGTTVTSIGSLTLSATAVSEYQPTGTIVGTLLAGEAGSGHAFTYSLIPGADDNASFAVVGNQLVTAAIFDYSTRSSYGVLVSVTDESGNTYEQYLTIAVIDVPALVRNGSTLTVDGTSGGVAFGFTGGTIDTFTLNGASYAVDSSTITTVVFNGDGNSDTATIAGSGPLTAVMSPTYDTLTGSAFTLVVYNVPMVDAYGNAGDTAYLYDGSGGNVFVGGPDYSYLQGNTYYEQAAGFQSVSAYETTGSYDIAYLYDGVGSNFFAGGSTFSDLQGERFFLLVAGFQQVSAYETSGSHDVAYLADGPGSNTFEGASAYSYLYGNGFINFVSGFQSVWAYGTAGNNDAAYLTDGSGTTSFAGQNSYGYLDANGTIYGAVDFGDVTIIATGNNQDYANGGSLNYRLTKIGSWH